LILSQTISNLFNDIRDAAQTIAPVVVIVGFMSLVVLYLDSRGPIVRSREGDNLNAANYV
jgi:hypothetical protein